MRKVNHIATNIAKKYDGLNTYTVKDLIKKGFLPMQYSINMIIRIFRFCWINKNQVQLSYWGFWGVVPLFEVQDPI